MDAPDDYAYTYETNAAKPAVITCNECRIDQATRSYKSCSWLHVHLLLTRRRWETSAEQ